MQRKRIIVSLDVRDGCAVAGARDIGDPVEIAVRHENDGADEIILLDRSESDEGRATMLEIVQRAAERLTIPLTAGGNITDVESAGRILRAGANRIAIDASAVLHPESIADISQKLGTSCVVACIDARAERRQIEILARPDNTELEALGAAPQGWFRVFANGGRTPTQINAVQYARQCADLGAGELLVSNIDTQDRRSGYDLELIARVVEAVNIPVIASGGAGEAEHLRDAFLLAGADAAVIPATFTNGTHTIAGVKRVLTLSGVAVREVPAREIMQ